MQTLTQNVVARVAAKASRSRRCLSVKAEAKEDGAIVKKDRSKDPNLAFGGLGASERSLSYLDGTLPGDRGCAGREAASRIAAWGAPG